MTEIDQATVEKCAAAAVEEWNGSDLSSWDYQSDGTTVWHRIALAVLAASGWGEELQRWKDHAANRDEEYEEMASDFAASTRELDACRKFLSVAEQRVSALEAALRDHHNWQLNQGTVWLEDMDGKPTISINGPLEYSESSMCERTIAALASAPPAPAPSGDLPSGVAERKFLNEFDREISLFVMAGKPGQNVSSRITMIGRDSTAENNMTRMEMEQLHAVMTQALGPAPAPERDGWRPTHRHYKGDLYRLLGEVRNSEDRNAPFEALYQNEYGHYIRRPLAIFNETLPDGRKRFEPLPSPPREMENANDQ
jgi:hypothetical protein